MALYQKIYSLQGKTNNFPSQSYSDDHRFLLFTDSGIFIVTPEVKSSEVYNEMKFKLSRIPSEKELLKFDVGVNTAQLQHSIREAKKDINQLICDRTLVPEADSHQFKMYLQAKWSPKGADDLNRCVVAALTSDHRLCIHMQQGASNDWTKVVDLSDVWYKHVKTTQYEDAASRWSDIKGDAQTLEHLRRRTYFLSAVAIEWSPQKNLMSDGKYEEKKRKIEDTAVQNKCCYLTVCLKSGHIVFWKMRLPMSNREDFVFAGVLDVGEDIPSCVCWCYMDCDSAVLAVGYMSGVIKCLTLDMSDPNDVKKMSEVTIWEELDKMYITNFCWDKKNKTLLATKNNYLLGFELKNVGEGIKVTKTCTTNIETKLQICGLQICNDLIYVASSDSSLFTSNICRDKGRFSFDDLSECQVPRTGNHWWSSGLSVFANGALLAITDSPKDIAHTVEDKDPLKINIFSQGDPNVWAQKLCDIKVENLADIVDILMVMKQYIYQMKALPPAFKDFLSRIKEKEKLSHFELQLLGYILSVQLGSLSSQSDSFLEEKANCETQLATVQKEILTRHILKTLDSFMKIQKSISDTEKQLVANMISWKESSEAKSDTSKTIQNVKKKIGKRDSLFETCQICSERIPMDNYKEVVCANGHSFLRCCQTLLICHEMPIRSCQGCECVAIRITKDIESKEWLSSLTRENCTFCNNILK